jgi:predicted MFS family arabinose efflux permease
VLWAGVAGVSAGRLLGPVARRRLLLGVAVYSTIGIAMNAISPSSTERAIWVPVTAVGAGLAWMAWRESAAMTAQSRQHRLRQRRIERRG